MRIGILTGEEYGTNYYRGTLVKRLCDRRGIGCFHTHYFVPWEFEKCDCVYLLRPSAGAADDLIPQLHALKRAGVPILVDADDHIFDVPEWSPAANVFDRHEVEQFYRAIYAMADVVTSPSRYLANAFRRYAPDAEFRIIPNAFDPAVKLLKPLGKLALTGQIPNIGWAGGAQHAQDLAALDPVWKALLEEKGYGLSFVGDHPRSVSRRDRVKFYGGCQSVELYMQTLPIVGLDVALAPLLPNEFNRSKSSLKAAEYLYIAGCPMVLSDIEAYDEIEADGKRIFKVKGFDRDAWLDAIEKGLTTMRTEGRRYELQPRFDMSRVIDLWLAAFVACHRRVRGRYPDGVPEAIAEKPAELDLVKA